MFTNENRDNPLVLKLKKNLWSFSLHGRSLAAKQNLFLRSFYISQWNKLSSLCSDKVIIQKCRNVFDPFKYHEFTSFNIVNCQYNRDLPDYGPTILIKSFGTAAMSSINTKNVDEDVWFNRKVDGHYPTMKSSWLIISIIQPVGWYMFVCVLYCLPSLPSCSWELVVGNKNSKHPFPPPSNQASAMSLIFI